MKVAIFISLILINKNLSHRKAAHHRQLIASDESGYIYITDIDKQRTPNSQICSSSAINCIRFANSNTIASVSMSGQLILWDLREGKLRMDADKEWSHTTLPKKHGALISLAVHPHRNHIFATGTESGAIAVWDIENRDRPFRLFEDQHVKGTLVNDVQFLPKSGLVSCGNDGFTQML